MASDYGDGAGGPIGSGTVVAYVRAVVIGAALAAGGFLVANLLQIPLVLVLVVAHIGLRSPVGYSVSSIVQDAGFALVVVGFMRYADLPDLLSVRWPSRSQVGRALRDLGWVIGGLLALFVLSDIAQVLLQRFGVQAGENQVQQMGENNPRLLLYLIVLAFVATGPGEELLFRGGVQGLLRRVFSPVPAILVSSALFGLAHVTAVVASSGTHGVLGYVVTTFLLGAVLGTLYERTDNLLVPILVHGAYDAILFAVMYVRVTGNVPGFA